MKTSYHQIYEHDITKEDYMQMGYYNIDSDLDIIKASITEHFNNQKVPQMSHKKWQELTPKERKVWNQYPPKQNRSLVLRISRGLQ